MSRGIGWIKANGKYVLGGAVIAFLAVAMLAMVLVPSGWGTTGPSGLLAEIHVFRAYDSVTSALLSVLLASPLIALLVGILCFRRWWWRLGLMLVFLVLAPASCAVGALNNVAPWRSYGRVTTKEGVDYRFMDSSFMQGQQMAIVRVEGRDRFCDNFAVVVLTNGDAPEAYIPIVRPENPVNEYGQLYLTADGWLVGVRYDNDMYMAYDLSTGKGYDNPDVEELSPFLCIGSDTKLYSPDVESVFATGIGVNDDSQGNRYLKSHQYRRETIAAALQHPNPEVRRIAQELLDRAGAETEAPGR